MALMIHLFTKSTWMFVLNAQAQFETIFNRPWGSESPTNPEYLSSFTSENYEDIEEIRDYLLFIPFETVENVRRYLHRRRRPETKSSSSFQKLGPWELLQLYLGHRTFSGRALSGIFSLLYFFKPWHPSSSSSRRKAVNQSYLLLESHLHVKASSRKASITQVTGAFRLMSSL